MTHEKTIHIIEKRAINMPFLWLIIVLAYKRLPWVAVQSVKGCNYKKKNCADAVSFWPLWFTFITEVELSFWCGFETPKGQISGLNPNYQCFSKV